MDNPVLEGTKEVRKPVTGSAEHLRASGELATQQHASNSYRGDSRIRVRQSLEFHWDGARERSTTRRLSWRTSMYFAASVSFVLALWRLSGDRSGTSAHDSPVPADEPVAHVRSASSAATPSTARRVTAKEDGCCRICRRGKACGDACVPLSSECHEPPGCACQGDAKKP